MKNLSLSFFVIAGLCMAMPCFAQTYDFSAVAPSGQMLYYGFSTSGTVSVVYPALQAYVSGDLTIPDTVTYNGIAYPVTSIGNNAFSNCSSLTGVNIPNSVTSIGNSAFYECTSLVSVFIPNSVTSIGTGAFTQCSSLTSVNIPNSVTSINDRTFYYCTSLPSINIPNSITSIGSQAFSRCFSLTSVNIPNSVTSIGSFAFNVCSSLTCLTIPSSVTSIANSAFSGCSLDTLNEGHVWPLTNTPYVQAQVINIPCGATFNYQQGWGNLNYHAPDPGFVTLSVSDGSCGRAYTWPEATCIGSTVIIIAEAFPGYHFAQWNDGNTDNGRSITLTQDTSFTAYFTPDVETPICMVTVENDHNVVLWEKEQPAPIYLIYRESTFSGIFELLDSVPYESLSSWTDTSSHPRTRSYRYMISAKDNYGVEFYSEPHKTMHLTINQGLGNQWNLVWTEYEGTNYSTYIIYRGTDPSNIQILDIMPSGGNTSYTDVSAPAGDVYYQVGIMLDSSCNSSKNENVVLSNVATNSTLGIESIGMDDVQVYTHDGHIVINGEYEIWDVQMYDISGRLLKTIPVNNRNTVISIAEFATGLYVMRMNTANGPHTRKIVR